MLEQRQAILENQNRLLERLVAMSQDHSFANRQIITELKNLNRSVISMDERRYVRQNGHGVTFIVTHADALRFRLPVMNPRATAATEGCACARGMPYWQQSFI